MKKGILQKAMWTLFRPTFQKNLSMLGVEHGRTLMNRAKKQYEQILKGIPEATPAICRYDYGMTKLTGAEFSREQTLAGGGTVCDCHYRKRI